MQSFKILDREIGPGQPAYIIAEVSCNHEGDIEEAKRIIKAAADGGADAVKIQTYTPDTMSRDFKTSAKGTMWSEIDLYKLYEKAQTPWEWSFELKDYATQLGVHFFSSPFDETAVDFLVNDLNVPVLKLASFEVVDLKLIEKMAITGLPVIMSNGMTDFLEMDEAVRALKNNDCTNLAILHCNSGYPAALEEANLNTIAAIQEIYQVPVGVSDHTLFADHENYRDPVAHVAPIEAVRLGACIIEVHLTTDRNKARALFEKDAGGYDWPFSMNPDEFKKMVDGVRHFEKTGKIEYETDLEKLSAEKTHGEVCFTPTKKEMASRDLRPSLWAVRTIKKGERLQFAAEDKAHGNFDSIRPGGGLHIRYTDIISGKPAIRDINAGEPLSWDMIEI